MSALPVVMTLISSAGVPEEQWTWTDVPGAVCGNGSPTGIGLNVRRRSEDLLIYLQAGGACWDTLTCAYGGASNLRSGYGAKQFRNESVIRAAPFQRSIATNPFREMSMVFVPYCTGDVHAGHAVQHYPGFGQRLPAMTVHHEGGANFQKILGQLKTAFPNARRVFVTGSSAGGFGAQLNFEKVVAAWPSAEVHLLADSAQILNPTGGLYATWLESWKLEVPADCAGCVEDFTKFPKYLHGKYPKSRFALLGSSRDTVLPHFFQLDGVSLQRETKALVGSAYGTKNAKSLVIERPAHVLMGDLFELEGALDFVTRWVKGES